MNARADFVSRTTGRVLLSALFDAPPEGLTRRECQRIVTILRQTKEKLEEVSGEGTVRLSLDDFSSSVFWYLALFRPIVFDPDDPWFGGEPWSLYELLEDPIRSAKLKEMNLGVTYDSERNWLTLIWDEAIKGLLDGIETCPSWRKVLKEYEDRTGQKATKDWWKLCARSHSFSIPTWRVAKHGYLRGNLWHRPNIGYEDIVVFNLDGIDTPSLDNAGKVSLPTPKRAKFVHFYTEDKREFKIIQDKVHPYDRGEKHRVKMAEYSFQKRKKFKEENAAWHRASAAIYDIARLMGGGNKGRRLLYVKGIVVKRRFHNLANRFNNGVLRIGYHDSTTWKEIELRLDIIKECLADPTVPREFELWLQWRKKGEAIDNVHMPSKPEK